MTSSYSVIRDTDIYNETVEMLDALNENELRAIRNLIQAFIGQAFEDEESYSMTEEEAFKRIESSVYNAKNGVYEDAEKVVADIIEEFVL